MNEIIGTYFDEKLQANVTQYRGCGNVPRPPHRVGTKTLAQITRRRHDKYAGNIISYLRSVGPSYMTDIRVNIGIGRLSLIDLLAELVRSKKIVRYDSPLESGSIKTVYGVAQ